MLYIHGPFFNGSNGETRYELRQLLFDGIRGRKFGYHCIGALVNLKQKSNSFQISVYVIMQKFVTSDFFNHKKLN